MLVRPGLEPSTSCTTIWYPTNWANPAAHALLADPFLFVRRILRRSVWGQKQRQNFPDTWKTFNTQHRLTSFTISRDRWVSHRQLTGTAGQTENQLNCPCHNHIPPNSGLWLREWGHGIEVSSLINIFSVQNYSVGCSILITFHGKVVLPTVDMIVHHLVTRYNNPNKE